jgi:hypothetical protein
MALREDLAFPSGLVGPFDFAPLARAVSDLDCVGMPTE